MIAMAVSSFPPEPSYISGKIVHVISEKTSECNHIAKCMHDSYGSIFLSSRTYMWENKYYVVKAQLQVLYDKIQHEG